MEMYLWLFGTAVLFTVVGWAMGRKSVVHTIVTSTIDKLIKDGYLKTRGNGTNLEILKWKDWNNDQAN
jgi:hypothetical protein